jgi:hypothetical protein
MTAPSAIAALRLALRNKARSHNLGTLGKELGIGIGALEEFAYGRGELSPPALAALADSLQEQP